MTRLSCWLTAILLLCTLTNLQAIDLKEALDKHLIHAEMKGIGGYHGEKLDLTLTNRTRQPIQVRVPAGWVFSSEEEMEQDLMVLREELIALRPQERKTARLFTACTQSSNASPSRYSTFLLGALADQPLLKLAELLSQKKYWESYIGQRVVWDFANKSERNLRHLRGTDSLALRDISALIEEVFGIEQTEIEITRTPAPIRITSISTSVDTLLENGLRNASLKAYDSAGNLVNTYFEHRDIPRGYFHYRFGLNHTKGDSARFFLKLTSESGTAYERTLSVHDTVVQVHRMKSGLIDFHYSLPEGTKADLGVYDGQGRLYHLVREGYYFKGGNHLTQLKLTTYLPKRDDYVVRIQAGDKVLSEQPFDPDARPKAQRFPRKVERGVLNFKIEEPIRNVRVAVYDEAGKQIRELYHNSSFGHGYKQVKYMFFHWQGPDATFFIRFENQETNEILLEKCIRCE